MNVKFTCVFLAGWLALLLSAGAQDDQLTKAQIEDLAKNLHYQQGQIKIKDGLAILNVPTNFYYLDPQDAKTVLVKFWGESAVPGRQIARPVDTVGQERIGTGLLGGDHFLCRRRLREGR